MAETIGAKCFTCGFIVRVPASYGGKKGKCPKCSDMILIPVPSETGLPVVGDHQLKEVAVGDVETEGFVPEEDEVKPPPAAAARGRLARPGTARRATGSTARAVVRGKRSPLPLIIGIVVAVVAVAILVAVLASR